MSDRERWIVYPLIFLCLGVSLRDKVTHSTAAKLIDAELIRCQAIQIGENEPGQFRGGILPGTITSFLPTGQPVAQFGPNLQCQKILVNDVAGVPQVRIGSVTRRTPDENKPLSSGVITIHGETGHEIIGLRARHQLKLEVRRLPGEDQSEKFALEVASVTEQGGLVRVFDSERSAVLVLTHTPDQLGLYAYKASEPKKVVPLAAIRKDVKPSSNPTNLPKDTKAGGRATD